LVVFAAAGFARRIVFLAVLRTVRFVVAIWGSIKVCASCASIE
jgi:hypothetical protein